MRSGLWRQPASAPMSEGGADGAAGGSGQAVGAGGTGEVHEVLRSWDSGAVASLLAPESEDILDLLDPLQAWGRPVAADAIEATPAPPGQAVESRTLPGWWSGTLVRTVRLSVLDGGATVAFCEFAVLRRAVVAQHRACRICFEEDGSLLDGCACRGTMRFICKSCLVLQWSTRAKNGDAATALKCSLCHQDFTGKALEILTEKIGSAVQKHEDDFPTPSPAEEEERYKMQIATATQLWKQGSHAEAADLFRKTIPGLQHLKGPKDPLLLSAQHNFSLLLTAQGRLGEAKTHVGLASRGFAELYGAEHPLTLKAAHNEAMVAQLGGQLAEARGSYEAVLEARRRVLGPDSLDTLKTSCNLGLVMLHAGDKDEAEALIRTTLQDMEQLVGRRHPLALVALQNLSLVLAEREPISLEAEALAREALEGKQRALGAEHPDTLEGWRDLATVLTKSGREDEAEQALRQTLAGMQKVLGFSHPTTEKCVRQLTALLRGRGQSAAAEELLDAHGRGAPASDAGELPAPVPEGNLVLALLSLYVAPAHRRKGLGSALVKHCKAIAREMHAEAVEASVLATSEGAISFLLHSGFVEAEELQSRMHLHLKL